MSAANKMRGNRGAVLLASLAFASPALAQYTGVSQPDQAPVGTAPESAPRTQVTYVPAAPAPATTTGIVAPSPAPASTFTVVGTPSRPRTEDREGLRERERDDAADAGVVTEVKAPANGLAAGTVLRARLLASLSTLHTPVGTEWTAELSQPLERDGRVIVPAGATVHGRVADLHSGRRITGRASIHLEPTSIVLPDGTTLHLHAQVVDTDLNHAVKVDDEGTILRRDHKKEEGSVLALTTGSGAAAGAVVAGPPGALVGAGIGAGVSTALWLKEDRQAELPRNTNLTFQLTRALSVERN